VTPDKASARHATRRRRHERRLAERGSNRRRLQALERGRNRQRQRQRGNDECRRTFGAGHRQPSRLCRDDQQQQRHDERRRREQHERRPADQCGSNAATRSGEHTGGDTEDRCEEQRRRRKRGAVGGALANELHHGTAILEGLAEIEGQRATEPLAVLRRQRAIETEPMALGAGDLGVAANAGQRRRVVPWRQPREHERAGRRQEHEGRRGKRPAQHESQRDSRHVPLFGSAGDPA
jgi:hypothetical protein